MAARLGFVRTPGSFTARTGMAKMHNVERMTHAQTAGAFTRRQKKIVRTAAPKGIFTVKTSFTTEKKLPIRHADTAPSASTRPT